MESARVSRRGADRWLRGHPWIYRSDVLTAPDGPGGAVLVRADGVGTIGMALWSPASTISLRMLTRDERRIDAGFWRERLDAALAYREALAPDATAYRVVHAEADGLPSLVVDRYADYLVVQLLSAGLEAFRSEIVSTLVERLHPAGVLARNDGTVRGHESLERSVELLHGVVPEEVEVREGGVRYLAAPWQGQKTGAFLDQRENRARAGALTRRPSGPDQRPGRGERRERGPRGEGPEGRPPAGGGERTGRALDCFAYHGSFALHLATGAREVVAVDSSDAALRRAEANAKLNGFDHIRCVEANVFDLLRAQESAGERYDVIVLDPPAFAKRKDAVPQALRAYKEINLRALRLLAPGGHLCTFTCSFHVDAAAFAHMLHAAAADAGRGVRWVEARGQASDHPQLLQVPETGYLKGAVLQAV